MLSNGEVNIIHISCRKENGNTSKQETSLDKKSLCLDNRNRFCRQQIKNEIRQAKSERDDVESNYLQMKKYLSDNKSNLELTITNARLERENNSLKSENKLLKAVINNISDFIESHNLPEPVKRGVKEIIDSLKQKQPSRGMRR